MRRLAALVVVGAATMVAASTGAVAAWLADRLLHGDAGNVLDRADALGDITVPDVLAVPMLTSPALLGDMVGDMVGGEFGGQSLPRLEGGTWPQ